MARHDVVKIAFGLRTGHDPPGHEGVLALIGLSGKTALHIAATLGHTRAAKWLAEHGAVINAPDDNDCITPLMDAVAMENIKTARFLLGSGASHWQGPG